MAITDYTIVPSRAKREQIRLNIRAGKVSATLKIVKFIDKDTKQTIFYTPSLELSGYGATVQKAQEMFIDSINDYMKFLVEQGPIGSQQELSKRGWKKTMFHKQFSRMHVDENGELQNLNAEENSIERLTLVS